MTGFYPIKNLRQCGAEMDPRGEDEHLEDALRGFHFVSRAEAKGLRNLDFSATEEPEYDEEPEQDFAEDAHDFIEGEGVVADGVSEALELQRFFAKREKRECVKEVLAEAEDWPPEPEVEELEVTEVIRHVHVWRSYISSSTYRPTRNARKPFVGSRTLKTASFDFDTARFSVVAVEVDGRRYRVARAS